MTKKEIRYQEEKEKVMEYFYDHKDNCSPELLSLYGLDYLWDEDHEFTKRDSWS